MDRSARTRRIVHVTTVGETLFFLRGLLAHLRRNGFDVHVVSSPGPQLTSFATAEGVHAHAIRMPRRISPLSDLAALARLTALFRHLGPVLVHAHTPKAGLLAMMAATMARVPGRVYHVHGLPLLTATGVTRRLLAGAERISCRLAHVVLCVSPSVRDVAVQERLAKAGAIEVLGSGSINGVDAVRFTATSDDPRRRSVRATYGIPDDARVVGFVGRLVKDKGVPELLAAFGRISRHCPDVHLLIAGPFEQRDALPASVVDALRSNPRIHLAGRVEDMPPVYAAIDVLLLPTHREGLPVVPLEAAAMGLPVVATRVAGCVDAVRDGITGTLVPVGDAEALAAAALRYLEDGALAQRNGAAGRRHVLEHFKPERLWGETLSVYQRVMNARQ